MLEELKQIHFPDQVMGFSFTEYLTIFLGLIFALAVAEFFISIGVMIRERHRFDFYWEFFLWIFILLDLFILTWYVYWVRLSFVSSGLAYFFLFTLPNLMIFLIVANYFPSMKGKKQINLKQHFLGNVRLFFTLFSIYLAFNLITELVLKTKIGEVAMRGQGIYLAFSLLNIFFPSVWLRSAMVFLFAIHITGLLIIL